ncbi:hypothetical protein E2C01_058671 [Portunus trituberculatus]|uniref:Uncharacterized protein n=1 Tax=Portunus trituberculatus TaxID=210409 RepID=A0A5B7H3B5_PORTR|nr:hypothetical protein [Portunus trituberculatus]
MAPQKRTQGLFFSEVCSLSRVPACGASLRADLGLEDNGGAVVPLWECSSVWWKDSVGVEKNN